MYKTSRERKGETRNTGSGSTIIAESVELGFNVVQERSGFIERLFEIRFVLGQYITVSFLQKEKRIKSNLTNQKKKKNPSHTHRYQAKMGKLYLVFFRVRLYKLQRTTVYVRKREKEP